MNTPTPQKPEIGDRIEARLRTQLRTVKIEIEDEITLKHCQWLLSDFSDRWKLIKKDAQP
jgi:hypothetical protein